MGVALLIGVLSGSRDVLQPLSKLGMANAGYNDAAYANNSGLLPFQYIKSVAELDAKIQQSEGKYVMVDFYADWCISCKEMERFTLSDPRIHARLADAVLIKIDVTAGTPDDMALLQRFSLFGPPGILFIDPQGNDIPDIRVIGFLNKDDFLTVLDAVLI